MIDLVSDEEGVEADCAPSGSLVPRMLLEADLAAAGLEVASRSPRFDVVLPALVLGLHALYREEGARPYWMLSCSDNDLRTAG